MSIYMSVGLVGVCLIAGGCQSAHPRVKAHDAERAASAMALLAGLDGEWELANPSEEIPEGRAVFAVSSAGSVVREIMVPGTPHEMTNLYHMDGDVVVCTHYCAAGNQPRMVATEVAELDGSPGLVFELDSVSNFLEDHSHYMGGLTLVFVSEDRIDQRWTSFDASGETAGEMVFEMKRVRGHGG